MILLKTVVTCVAGCGNVGKEERGDRINGVSKRCMAQDTK
jgi:hypothetical protein